MSTVLAVGGLIVAIVGTVVVFLYGIPAAEIQAGFLRWEDTEESAADKTKAKRRARIGLGMLIVGQVLQLAALLVPSSDGDDCARCSSAFDVQRDQLDRAVVDQAADDDEPGHH